MININKLIGGSITITTKPIANPKTKITFTDGTSQEYDWSGEINLNTIIAAGLFSEDGGAWIKRPQTVEIGTNVTSIGDQLFYYCSYMTSVTIPNSVTSIGKSAFGDCDSLTSVMIPDSVSSIRENAFFSCGSLTSVTFSGKDKATVQSMANYNWGLNSGCILHCTDGDITI